MANTRNPLRALYLKHDFMGMYFQKVEFWLHPIKKRHLGKDPATKSDEFLENFQTAFDPPSFSENYIAYIANFL